MYIPKDIRQKPVSYSLGKYVLHPVHQNNKVLENWITSLQFEKFELPENRLQLHSRKRNHLYSFYLPAINKEVILKVSQTSKNYRWYRQLNLFLVSLFKDYSLNAFYGGLALEKSNVDSIKVIAHWTSKHQKKNKKSYLLYEKITSSISVFDLCTRLSKENENADELIRHIAKSLAKIIRKIHTHNLRHGDPHAGNFLVNSTLPEIGKFSPDTLKDLNFILIDLDKTQFAYKEAKWKKKIMDIRCIRRFRVHDLDADTSLAYYLDRPPTAIEKGILRFWMGGGFNIYKWFKPNKKRN